MIGQWGILHLKRRDALVCYKCYKTIEDQKVHMYINVDFEIDKVMCENCWKTAQEEASK
jgi:uncharacterized CHY-type Zn-finger protein